MHIHFILSQSLSDDSEPHGLLRCDLVGRFLIRLLLFFSSLTSSLLVIDEQHRYTVETDAVGPNFLL